jgi:hypothetical protein
MLVPWETVPALGLAWVRLSRLKNGAFPTRRNLLLKLRLLSPSQEPGSGHEQQQRNQHSHWDFALREESECPAQSILRSVGNERAMIIVNRVSLVQPVQCQLGLRWQRPLHWDGGRDRASWANHRGGSQTSVRHERRHLITDLGPEVRIPRWASQPDGPQEEPSLAPQVAVGRRPTNRW